jgi:hypothetical protein
MKMPIYIGEPEIACSLQDQRLHRGVYIWDEGKMNKARPANAKERRASPRFIASELIPHAVTKLATGQEVELVNFSLDGAILISSGIMLAPGACVHLRMAISGASMSLEGRVQRCRVIGLKQEKIQYEAAIILDEGIPLPLAAILELSDAKKSPSKPRESQNINPDTLPLPDTAKIWVISDQEA